jgi:selenocysteine lyase/cysteine desulfurase
LARPAHSNPLRYIEDVGTRWDNVRDEFPVLERWRYLNTATFGPVPLCAAEAMQAHLADRDRTASLEFLSRFDTLDTIRAQAAEWIGAQSADIAFVPNAGVALSWILHGMEWRQGDRILALDDEFPNNLYAPGALAAKGVVYDAAPGGDAFDAEGFVARIGSRTRVVLISALNYASGFRPPLAYIGEACRRNGALFVVDGTQGVGAIPFDVEEARADFVLVHAYKWMCSPPGAGFLYVRPSARERVRPIVYSWRSHRGWRNVDSLHHGEPLLPEDAACFEGGIQNFSGLFAMGAVFEMMLGLGRDAILARTAELAALTRRTLADAGAEVPGLSNPMFASPIVTARFPGLDPSPLAIRLRERGIALAARKGYLRVSPHFFNSDDDIEALAEGVREYVAAPVR